MLDHILLFFIVWFNAVLRTFNNLHVMRLEKRTALPFSLMGAFVDMCVVVSIVKLGWSVFIPVGLGYGVGQITAMKIYEWCRQRSTPTPPENELK